MKKTLLLAVAAVAALSSQAAVSDYLTVTIGGTEVTEGAVFNINEYEDYTEFGMGLKYAAKIYLINKTANPVAHKFEISYTDHPTQAMATDKEVWGSVTFCWADMVEGSNCGTTLSVDMTVPAGVGTTADYDVDNTGATLEKGEKDRKYKASITVDGSTLTFFLNFNSEGTGVADIVAGEGTAEYYNLQGQRVENPAKGLYIVKQNGKTSKMMVR